MAGVITAATVEAALPLVRARAPQVVLYDPRTVPGDAVAAVRQLAQEGRPVVVLTSSLFPAEVTALPQAGATALLFKGIAIAPLLACLEKVRADPPARPPPAPAASE